MEMSLNELYNDLIAVVGEKIAPQGFVRKGHTFRAIKNENCGIIEFQKSTKSQQDVLLFTINVAVIAGKLRTDSNADLCKVQSADAHVRQRIGAFMPGSPDKWWEIRTPTDAAALKNEVADLIFKEITPFISQYLDTNEIIALWESGISPGITKGQRVRFLSELKSKLVV